MDPKSKSDKKKPAVRSDSETNDAGLESMQNIIRKRAYELYETRDGQQVDELDDWLQAEREIKERTNL